MRVTGGGREGDNAVKVPEIGVQSKLGSGISQQFKAKQRVRERRQQERETLKTLSPGQIMSGDRILMTFLLFMVRGVFGPIIVTDKQWLCHYCSMGEFHTETKLCVHTSAHFEFLAPTGALEEAMLSVRASVRSSLSSNNEF